MQFKVTDRASIEAGLRVRTPYIIVSIRDPRRPKACIPKTSALRAAIHLAFHDAEPVSSMALPPHIRLMTAEHARQIWNFVLSHQQSAETVVVHCEQGMSRSPAVAAALCRGMGGDDRPFFRQYSPNAFVYRLMLEAIPPGPREVR